MDPTDEVADRDFRDPPAFAPHGMAWYQIDDFIELVHAAKVAYYGNLGLFVHPWRRREQGFEWYADTVVGYDNWGRDSKSLNWKEPAPEGPVKRILTVSDLIDFCKFTISQLLHEIVRFEASVSRQPELIYYIAGTPVRIFQCFDASKMILGVCQVCTNVLPEGRIPLLPDGNGAYALHVFLTRVLTESLNVAKPKPPVGDHRIPAEVDEALRNADTPNIPMRLIEFMWGRKRAEFADLVPWVWPDVPSAASVRKAIHLANDALQKILSDRTIHSSKESVTW